MKKVLYTLLIIINIIFTVKCGTEKNSRTQNEDIIIGKWSAVFLGNTVLQLGLSMPIKYEFKPTGEFNSSMTIAGETKIYSGTFKIDKLKAPFIINIMRTDNREFHGIIRFENEKKFIMILYDKKILPLAETFGQDDIQIYERSE